MKRSFGVLLVVSGCVVAALGMAGNPPWADPASMTGSSYSPLVGGVFAAAMGGYLRHRVSDPHRAPLWGLAYGASVVAMLAAIFGAAAAIRPTVRGIPGLGDTWSGTLMIGFLLTFVGAFLWERELSRRRTAALALLVAWLVFGGVFVALSADPWATLAAPVYVVGFGAFILALAMTRTAGDHQSSQGG